MKNFGLFVLVLGLAGCASAHRGGALPTAYRGGKAVVKAVAPPVAKDSVVVAKKVAVGAKVALIGRPAEAKKQHKDKKHGK